MAERHEKNTALRRTADRLKRAVDSGNLSVDKETRRYLQMWEPVRREYRRHLNEPCMTVLSYDIRETFPYLKGFRLWAYVEAADASLAIRAGNYRRALDDYETVMQVSEGLRNGGLMVHHLVAGTCINSVSGVIARSLPQMPVQACDTLVGIVRQWETVRVPAEQAWEHEWIQGIHFLHDLYDGKVGWRNIPGRLLNLRAAAHEYLQLYQTALRELRKPVAQQAELPEPEASRADVRLPDIYSLPPHGSRTSRTQSSPRYLCRGAGVSVEARQISEDAGGGGCRRPEQRPLHWW